MTTQARVSNDSMIKLNSYLIAQKVGPIDTGEPKDAGRFIEIQPIDEKGFAVGTMGVFQTKDGQKVIGKVVAPPQDYKGSNCLVDTFAYNSLEHRI